MRSPFVTFLHWNFFTVIANRFQLLQTAISSYQLNGSSKLYWSWTAEDNWITHVFRRINCWTKRPVDIYFSFKHFSVRYCISWECSDPNSSPQGVFTSSAVQTLASLPCNNWSLCWSNYRTSQCCLLVVCGEWTLEYLSSPNWSKFCNKLYLVWSVGRNSDWTKRGQTSILVVENEIQTSCNFKANLPDRYYLLGYYRCLFSNVDLESPDNHMVWHHRYTSVSYNLDLLLHKDFPHPPSSQHSDSQPQCCTTTSNKSTEHSTTQKGSFHCNMVVTDAGRLLSTSWCNDCFEG